MPVIQHPHVLIVELPKVNKVVLPDVSCVDTTTELSDPEGASAIIVVSPVFEVVMKESEYPSRDGTSRVFLVTKVLEATDCAVNAFTLLRS